ncbi:MAG: adenosine kinase [Candidatus Neomarinimicrobiota bacterium]
MNKSPAIYGIGNPIVDIIFHVSDNDIKTLGLQKGTMSLVTKKRQTEIINYLQIENASVFPGGSAPNTIIACNGLGVSSVLSGKIGNDKFGEIYLDQINKYDVFSKVVQGNGDTGTSVVLITPDAERTMNTHLGICREYSTKDIDKKLLMSSSFLYFTGYMWDTKSQKKAIQKAVEIAQSNNVKICFDVADPFVVERNREEFFEFIKDNVDIVFANQPELLILFQSEDIDHSIQQLMNIVECGGVKLGKKGSIVFNNLEKNTVKPKLITAKDTTGAGDMYAAGFLSQFFKTNDYIASGKIGSALAEEIIQINGAQFDKNKMSQIRSKFI